MKNTNIVTQAKTANEVKFSIGRVLSNSSYLKWNGTSIRFLEYDHIRSIIKSLSNNSIKVDKIASLSKEEWLKALKLELERRNNISSDFFKKFIPKFSKNYNKLIFEYSKQKAQGIKNKTK